MKNIILFDHTKFHTQLLPLSYTRPISELRVGILTIREKWEKMLEGKYSVFVPTYLSIKYPINIESDNLLINASLLPTAKLCAAINDLKIGQKLVWKKLVLAARMNEASFDTNTLFQTEETVNYPKKDFISIEFAYDIFRYNGEAIQADFDLICKGRTSAKANATNTILSADEENSQLFIEEGATLNCAIINTLTGPVYIGKDAQIMEGSMIRGPFALCNNATVKLGAKIYGPTTIGPHSKVGGEVSNSVITGYSNKGHDGYLGNSVLGEWCNIGADSNNSNLKNNYAEVRLWNYDIDRFDNTGLQFCGLIMGDHSKCGINTMFNTGTVIGVSSNIFGSGFPRNFVPSFAWGGHSGFSTYKLNKAFEVASKVMQRRKLSLSNEDKSILQYIFKNTMNYRTWDK